MNILFRAIITGFGLRLGSEIAKTVASKVRSDDEDDDDKRKAEEAENPEDEELGSVTPDPPVV